MSKVLKEKYIDQKRLILGVLRESIFTQSLFTFEVPAIGKTFSTEIQDVIEASRRDSEENRELVFSVSEDSEFSDLQNYSQPSLLKMSFGINNFIAHAHTNLIRVNVTGGKILIYVEVPSVLRISNLRKSQRRSLQLPPKASTIMVCSQGQHTEGVFDLQNFSRDGFGGILKVPNGFCLTADTRIIGHLHLATGWIRVAGQVTRARRIESRPGDWDNYYVGVHQDSTGGDWELLEAGAKDLSIRWISAQGSTVLPEAEGNERRKHSRTAVDEQVNLTPFHDSQASFRFIVSEASLTGFSGELFNPVHKLEYPIGMMFQIDSSPLRAILQGFDGDRYRFSIADGSVTERLNWLKRISRYLLKGISDQAQDAHELLQVFCESGALSAGYLQTQRTHKNEFLSQLEKNTENSFWIHRWVHHNADREISGQVMALRVGDHSWMLGDLAGSPDPSRRIPPQFTELFYQSFGDFSLTISPCPQVMHTWVVGHPYWREFQKKITEDQLLLESAYIGYTRYSRELSRTTKSDGDLAISVINSYDFQKIMGIGKELEKRGTNFHASFFDFNISQLGSPMLTLEFKLKQYIFLRRYLEFNGANSRWLAIFSPFPIGGSFNRIAEAVWVFLLEGSHEQAIKDWPILVPKFFDCAIRFGIKPSSIRRVSAADRAQVFPLENGGLESYIAHPSSCAAFRSR